MKQIFVRKNMLYGLVLAAVTLVLLPSGAVLGTKQMQDNRVNPAVCQGTTIYVDDNNTAGPWDGTMEHPYRFIKDGVNASHNGDTVFVFSGMYECTNMTINTSITLVGEQMETTWMFCRFPIAIQADMVNVSDFTLSSENYPPFNTYKILITSNHCTITENHFQNTVIPISMEDIVLNNAQYTTITKNSFEGADVCIYTLNSSHTIIQQNSFFGLLAGIVLFNSMDTTITQNIVTSPYCSIMLMVSLNNTISSNNVSYDQYGVYLVSSIDNMVTNNNFIRLTDPSVKKQKSVYSVDSTNTYDGNYWDKPRILPKVIFGLITIFRNVKLPLMIQIDRHPAKTPNTIT
jgi:parallel beta-helix repeat protein